MFAFPLIRTECQISVKLFHTQIKITATLKKILLLIRAASQNAVLIKRLTRA